MEKLKFEHFHVVLVSSFPSIIFVLFVHFEEWGKKCLEMGGAKIFMTIELEN